MIQRLMVPLAYRSLAVSVVTAGIVSVLLVPVRFLRGEESMSATLREISAGVSWAGNSAASSETFDPATCRDSRTCDVFTLTVDISEDYRKTHPAFAVVIRLGWEDPQNDFDLYIGRGDETIEVSRQGQTNSEEVYLAQPANGIYRVFTHTVSASTTSAYMARVRVLPSAPSTTHRLARYQQDPDGVDGPAVFQFSHEEVPQDGTSGTNVRTSIEMDPFGNVRLVPVTQAGDSITDPTGRHFRVFAGASGRAIYLGTNSGTRRIYSGTGDRTVAHPRPVIAADQAGGLHVAFNDGYQLFLLSSADHGTSWKDPVSISNPEDPQTATASSLSIFAGDSGRVGLLWLNDAGELYYGVTLDAFASGPSIDYVRLTGVQDMPAVPSGTIDSFGNAAIAYGGKTFLRQVGGRKLLFPSFMTVAGTLETETGIKNVGFTIRQDFSGYLTFVDEPRKLSMKLARFNSSRHMDGKIVLSGRGNLQDGTAVTFTMLTSAPESSDHDLSISMSNGYFAAGVIHNRESLAAKMLN